MGQLYSKDKQNDYIPVYEEVYGVLINNDNFVQFLVGDYPYGYLKPETEEIPYDISEKEYYNTLADAYLCGII